MNKHVSTSFLIIVSILMLALKDSAGFIHTVLHYIPNNPWHQHTPAHTHKINPLEIHKYLQYKHAHIHEHNEPDHTHTHDVMDHFHSDSNHNTQHHTPAENIKLQIKIDVFFQQYDSFQAHTHATSNRMVHFPSYFFSPDSRSILPPLQPPQA